MPKKCIICSEDAEFNIKGTNDYYCKECAIEHFGDLSMLIKVEEIAKKIKDMIDKKNKAPQEEELENELIDKENSK
jgi:Zn-finger protein